MFGMLCRAAKSLKQTANLNLRGIPCVQNGVIRINPSTTPARDYFTRVAANPAVVNASQSAQRVMGNGVTEPAELAVSMAGEALPMVMRGLKRLKFW